MHKLICIIGFGLYCIAYGLGVEAVGFINRLVWLALGLTSY